MIKSISINIVLLFLIIICCAPSLSFSQVQLNQSEYLDRPKLFNDGLITSDLNSKYLVNAKANYTSQELSATSGVSWKVWSDRKENPLFKSPSISSDVITFLDFMQPLYVTETSSNGWLKVIYLQSGSTKKYSGWIQGRYLQLTPYALAKDGISRKAVVLADGDAKFNVDTTDTEAYKRLTQVYHNPKMDFKV